MISRIYSFDIEDAVLFEERGAVILNNIRYWILKNQSSNQNYHKGHYWTYNTIAGFKNYHPYLTEKQISTTLLKLEKSGVLITDNFNKRSYDRTKWYCINEPLLRKMKLDFKTSMPESQLNDENENLNIQKDSFLEENITISVEKLSQALKNTNLPNGKMEFTKKENDNLPNGKMTISQKVNTIPDNKTNNKSINKIEREQNFKNFVTPSLLEINDYIKKENLKNVSADSFYNFYQGKNWYVGKNKMKNWENQIKAWESREVEKLGIKPAIKNIVAKKEISEREKLEAIFRNKTIEYVKRLQADATALETARQKFNKECGYKNELHSQTVYELIDRYRSVLAFDYSMASDKDLKEMTLDKFKIKFFNWFKKQDHASHYFSETPNRWHKSTELQQ